MFDGQMFGEKIIDDKCPQKIYLAKKRTLNDIRSSPSIRWENPQAPNAF
jgi:hypothetical protein